MRFLFAIVLIAFASTSVLAVDIQTTLSDGWKLFDNKSYKAASRKFEYAVRVDPASAEAFKGLGMTYMKIGYSEYSQDLDMVQQAVSAFEKALRLNPNMPEVSYQLGLACLALDDKSGADKQYQALLPTCKPLANQLAVKIAAYKKPVQSHYLYNENNLAGDRQEALQALARERVQQEIRRGEAIEAAKAEERAEKKRLISAIEEARDAARSAEAAAESAEDAAREAADEADWASIHHH